MQFIATGAPAPADLIDAVLLSKRKGKGGGAYVREVSYSYHIGADHPQGVRHGALCWDIPYTPSEIYAGDLVLVVYDPADPDRNELDRFDARQADRLWLMA